MNIPVRVVARLPILQQNQIDLDRDRTADPGEPMVDFATLEEAAREKGDTLVTARDVSGIFGWEPKLVEGNRTLGSVKDEVAESRGAEPKECVWAVDVESREFLVVGPNH